MRDQGRSQVSEIPRHLTCDPLKKSVTGHWAASADTLYGQNGERKYLNHGERSRALAAMSGLDPERSLFALVLAWTGARVSEVLALTASSFQVETGIVTIITLKRRKPSVREVPIPPAVMRSLEHAFGLRRRQVSDGASSCRLWRFCRMTAWRIVKRVMTIAGIAGPQACPKGFRHGFGVGMVQASVPITLVQRWMGHARLSTTSIYLNVSGPEEIAFAQRFWRAAKARLSAPFSTAEFAACA